MSDEHAARRRWEDQIRKPFEPIFTASGKGIDTGAALRMAHAFEYIAAQLVKSTQSSPNWPLGNWGNATRRPPVSEPSAVKRRFGLAVGTPQA
jgi:hypothetical protein